MRGLVRAAAYLPTGTSEGCRVGGYDEDGFTLGSTALERAMDVADRHVGPRSLEILGDFPSNLDWSVSLVLGSAPATRRAEASGADLVAALGRAESGQDGGAAVLAVELPERSTPAARDRASPGAGAVAFWFEEGHGQPLRDVTAALSPGPTALGTSFELFRAAARSSPASWSGDWNADPRHGPPVDLHRIAPLIERSTALVSEGAYVPRPRYLENLPSRWRFSAESCGACGAITFPSRGRCRSCGRSEGLRAITLPRDGVEVVATTVIGPGGQPTEFDPQVESLGSYEVVLVELSKGVRVTLQVTDAEPGSVRIGDRVDTRLRRLYPMDGEWRYGRKAVPVLAARAA